MLRIVVLVLIVATLAVTPAAKAAPRPQEREPMRIATRVIEPFVIERASGLSGFSVELWEEIASRAGWRYEWEVQATIGDLLLEVQTGRVSAAVAAISMTPERETLFDFSYPIYSSGLQVMTRHVQPPWWTTISTNLGDLLRVSLALVILMVIFAHLVWLAERRSNPDFAPSYWPGVWEAFWFTAVTLTTVGYGDKTARTVVGRGLAVVWMLTGLVLVANFTATITTRLTLHQLRGAITGVDDLHRHRVMTVTGSTAADFLDRVGIGYQGVAAIDQAFLAVERGQADAIVYDSPVLRYYAAQGGTLSTVGDVFQSEPYGIALPPGSPLREEVNRYLLELISDGTYDRIYRRYFQASAEQ